MCVDCETARAQLWHGYRADCDGCKARQLATAPAFFESEKNGRLSHGYRKALRTLFGEDWLVAHEEVKLWAARLRELNEAATDAVG
jgi:hypothetical protein